MLIYMRVDVFVCVFGVFMSLVCPISVPAALRRRQKKHGPWICGACFNMIIYVFYVPMSLVCPISMPAALRRPQ